ncbi:MAG: Hsp20/alpha crystallin family protein [Verrucomicrobiota bacterium]
MKMQRRQRENRGAVQPQHQGGASPLDELNRIRSEINRLFENPFSVFAPSTSFFAGWQPTVDIYEDHEKATVRAELPGMKKEDINVALEGSTLTISGERKLEEEERQGDSYRAERFFGRFQRSITLPHLVDANKMRATYKDGVLEVICPKSEEAKPKQIQVKS